MGFNIRAYPNAPNVPVVKYPTYDATLSFKPKSLTITQTAGSGCGSYPICGMGTTKLTIDNKGTSIFATTGACSITVKPGFNGKKSESLPCSFPTGTLGPGMKATFTDTVTLDNVPYGKYTFTTIIDIVVGTASEQTKAGTFTVTATG